MTTKKDNRLLYEIITNAVFDWIKEQNAKNKKPLQSTIIGSLDMVKHDIYTSWSAKRIIEKKLIDVMNKLKGKSLTIDKEGGITLISDWYKDSKGEQGK